MGRLKGHSPKHPTSVPIDRRRVSRTFSAGHALNESENGYLLCRSLQKSSDLSQLFLMRKAKRKMVLAVAQIAIVVETSSTHLLPNLSSSMLLPSNSK